MELKQLFFRQWMSWGPSTGQIRFLSNLESIRATTVQSNKIMGLDHYRSEEHHLLVNRNKTFLSLRLNCKVCIWAQPPDSIFRPACRLSSLRFNTCSCRSPLKSWLQVSEKPKAWFILRRNFHSNWKLLLFLHNNFPQYSSYCIMLQPTLCFSGGAHQVEGCSVGLK